MTTVHDGDQAHLTTGELLALWLRRGAGKPLTGRSWQLADPLDRGSRYVETPPPPPCSVVGEPRVGGQAAVARGALAGSPEPVAIRAMLASTDPKAQQREKLQVGIGQLSRTDRRRLPALVETYESFLMSVPASSFYASDRMSQPGSATVEVWVHVLEWCPRSLLEELTAAAQLDVEDVVRRMLPVIRTLEGIHELGYVHRDLDPSNILVAEDGSLRVADFGIAVHMRTEHTHTMTEAWGKPGRMPPEALYGAQVPVGPAYDAWQAGFLLAEAATGGRPVLPDGRLSPRLADLPAAVRDVIRELLADERSTRLSLPAASARLQQWVDQLDEARRAAATEAQRRAEAERAEVERAEAARLQAQQRLMLATTLRPQRVPVGEADTERRQPMTTDVPVVETTRTRWSRKRRSGAALVGALVVVSTAFAADHFALGATPGEDGPSVAARASPTPAKPLTASPAAARPLAEFGLKALVYDSAIAPSGVMAISYLDSPDVQLWDLSEPTRPVRLAKADVKETDDANAFLAESVDISPNGEEMAVAYGGLVRVWNISDPRQPKLRYSLPEYSMYVPHVEYSPDGSLLATTGYDDQVHLWRTGVSKAKPVSVLTTDTSDIFEGAFSPDGTKLLAQSYEMTTLWDISTPSRPQFLANIKKVSASTFLSDSSIATVPVSARPPAASTEMSTWDISNPRRPTELAVVTVGGVSWLYSAPKRHQVLAGNGLLGGSPISVWDVSDPARPSKQTIIAGIETGDEFLFGPDGSTIIDAGSEDSPATVWKY